ncbi:MAG: MarR family winged helix-turn-helix transcriptional regulator [Thermoanaerobaculia bacterium]
MTKPGNGGATDVGESQLFELLRYSHIFASVVREILEIKLLNEVCPNSLTLSQFHLLKLISLNGKHQVGQIADFLGVSPPAATKNIDKLQGLGLVFRRQSKGDRRATLLTSSAKGRRLVEKYENLKAERLAPVLKAFNAEELDQLAHLLERFSLVLIHAEDSGEGLCFRCSAYFEDECPVTHLREGCPYQKVRGPRVPATGEMEA